MEKVWGWVGVGDGTREDESTLKWNGAEGTEGGFGDGTSEDVSRPQGKRKERGWGRVGVAGGRREDASTLKVENMQMGRWRVEL
jgi:hypothetical protein